MNPAHQILKTFSAVFARISEVFAVLDSYLEGETYYWIDGACWDIETGLLLQYDVSYSWTLDQLRARRHQYIMMTIDEKNSEAGKSLLREIDRLDANIRTAARLERIANAFRSAAINVRPVSQPKRR